MQLRYICDASKGRNLMTHGHHGCGRRGHIAINLPEGLLAMRGRGWQGSWGPFSIDLGDDGLAGWGGRRGRRARRISSSSA